MPAAKLPKKLHARLDDLASRVRKARLLRAVARTAFLLPAVALVCILADAYLGLPVFMRAGLLVGWVILAVREGWGVFRAIAAPVDLEAVASAVELEFPRLAERLTTAVELAGSADESNGSPALINEVIKDADTRARKLDLATAFPTGGSAGAAATSLLLLLVLLLPAFFAPRSGELLRRFFLPGYTPTKTVPYQIEVTSKDTAVKRGDPVTLTAVVKATKDDAVLPDAATLVVVAGGKEERVAMATEQANVWHGRRTAAEADFDYRVEAGGAVSETYHVHVVEPVTLAAAHVSVKPPAYAAQGREDQAVEGLGELSALEHSTITFDLKFVPRPATAVLEFAPDGDADNKPAKQRNQLKVADDGSVRVTVPARESGTFALRAEGAHGVRSEFPSQPLRVHKDEPPKLPRVSGLADKPRQVRPTEKIVVEAAATDDVAVTTLVLEWRVDNGQVQTVPLDARGLPAAQAEGKAVLALADKVKVGQKVYCRLAATDNRDLPEARLKPQTTYFPAGKDEPWSEFEINPAGDPLAEQDITQRKAEVAAKLDELWRELKKEFDATDRLEKATKPRKALDANEQEELRKVRDDVTESAAKTDDLARDVGVTPELSRLADALRGVSDRELRDAEAALTRAREEAQAARSGSLDKAKKALNDAMHKVDQLRRDNERIAQERMDRRKLDELAREQQELADEARKADPKDAADLARKQKDLEEQLNKLKESESVKKAVEAAQSEQAKKLAEAIEKISEDQRKLNESIARTEKDSAEQKVAELKKKQDELAKKAKELADKTDTASRVSETQPLQPDALTRAKEALDKGDLDEAAKQQEKARQELERLARELGQAAANTRDSREAARQLARLQEDLRNRLAQATMKDPLDKVPPERRAAMEKEQEAIEKAAAALKVPDGDAGAEAARQQAVADARAARDMLKKGAEKGADKKMQEAKESLEQLAKKLPTQEQRLAQARDELAKVKQQQEDIRKKAEAAAKAAEQKDPDAAATQKELAGKLEEAARKQAALAEKLSRMDAPGQENRKEKAADAMQKAASDLTAGRPQDAAASQQAVKRELDRLEQALNGQTPADDKVAELAKKQKQLADDAARNAANPDKATQMDLQRRQGEIARDLEKVQTPEAATAQSEAADAARKAEAAGMNPDKPDELARKAKEAADKLNQLDERVNGKEPAADAADRLAKKQKANAEEQDKRKDAASTKEARAKAGQELDELKNMRAGADAQKAKQKAQDALQKAANAQDPANNAQAQKDAADALKDLADTLTRKKPDGAESEPKDPAEAADRLAKKQKELAEKTKQELEQAKQMPGEAGEKAKKEALEKAAREQRDLARQADQVPGQDSPADRQRAQEAMRKAAEELDRENFEGAVRQQKDAADALDQLTREAQKHQREQAAAENPDLPNKAQAEAARQLAEEQRKLQEEARQAGEELARENAPRKDNPVEELARQQQEVARQAEELARTTADRQGAKSDQAKQARQAAEAAKQTSDQVKNGELSEAKGSGKKAADAMDQLAQDKAGGDSGQKAKDLARRQADINQKLEELAKDPGAGKAQQAARQQQLEQQAREAGDKLDQMANGSGTGERGSAGEKARGAAGSAKEAGGKMQAAREAGQKGRRDEAGQAREQAAEAMDRAARQARDAAKELAGGDDKGPGSPRAGEALGKAQDQMGQAGQKLGQGKPGEAGGAMEKAAQSLQQAAGQLGQGQGSGSGSGDGKAGQPSQGQGGKTPGMGGQGGKLDLTGFDPEVAKHTGKAWGELPGEIKTRIIQQMKARYGEDYARNIKLYFEQLAERK